MVFEYIIADTIYCWGDDFPNHNIVQTNTIGQPTYVCRKNVYGSYGNVIK